MRLRVSGEDTGQNYDLDAVVGADAVAGGVPNGAALSRFAACIVQWDQDGIAAARGAVVAAMGSAAMVDAAAVIAAFNAYPRAADATGIPLESAKAVATESLRRELALDARFGKTL